MSFFFSEPFRYYDSSSEQIEEAFRFSSHNVVKRGQWIFSTPHPGPFERMSFGSFSAVCLPPAPLNIMMFLLPLLYDY